jgi:two-component system cell cycle response regulator
VKRLILVDDSPSVRTLLGQRLREIGYQVEEFPSADAAAARVLEAPPDLVVTDLQMPGMSGVQLCRLLQADRSTRHVPVVLLTAAGDRRSRFWARSAGAVAYVSKTAPEDLAGAIERAIGDPNRPRAAAIAPPSRCTVQERLSQLLDNALFDSVIAGEVRALGRAGNMADLFAGLIALASEVIAYRWLAFAPEVGATRKMFLHTRDADRHSSTSEARATCTLLPETATEIVADDRPSATGGSAPACVFPIEFGGRKIGSIAIGFATRSVAASDSDLGKLIANELGGAVRIAALIEDARRLAACDALTGLPNRRAFVDAIERERSRASRHALPFSFVMIDVDHFKSVNDTHGHAAGDLVLQAVAKALSAIARRSDVVGRWGGEEFVVALPQTSEAGARVAAERLRKAIADTTCILPSGETIHVTASLGVASVDCAWQTDLLVARADSAMYEAKSNGRNRVAVSPMQPNSAAPLGPISGVAPIAAIVSEIAVREPLAS